MHSCYTSCSPTNSSLLWSVLLFFGIHGFQNRQVWRRLTLCRRLRHQCSFEDRKAWSRSNTNLLQFPDLKRRTTRFPFALLLFTWFRGNFISLRNYVPGFHYLGKKHLPLACGRVSYMTQEKSLKSQFCCSITASLPLLLRDFQLHGKWPQNFLCFLCGFLHGKAHDKHPIWDGGKPATSLLRLLEEGLCSPAKCWPPSHPHEADGSCEHLGALRHG